jgi:hypothetical protein
LLFFVSTFVAASMPVQGLERLQAIIDGQTVREAIAISYYGPEGDPVSALMVKVTGVSGAAQFVIDPANSQGCRNGE